MVLTGSRRCGGRQGARDDFHPAERETDPAEPARALEAALILRSAQV
jgi:hypothetical protein